MTKRRPRFDLPPRVLSPGELAGYLGRSLTWYIEHKEELEAAGFPKPLEILGGHDRAAVDAWLDQRGGLAEEDFDEAWARASDG